MAELIPVNIVIAERTYRLKIDSGDEEMLRKTVKLINDKVYEFKSSFAGKDMQDYIAMVLIWLATERSQDASALPPDLFQRLADMEKSIDNQLSK